MFLQRSCGFSRRYGRHHLAGVEDIQWIERGFSRPHEIDRAAVLKLHGVDLARADTVFAGAGAIEGYRPADEPVVDLMRLGQFGGARRIDDETEVEVAIADMSNRRDEE